MFVEANAKKTGMTLIILLLLGIFSSMTFLPANVSAKTLYVGGGGPGNYTTIQGAIDAATKGDTVFVYSGVYFERIVVNKTVSLNGEKGKLVLVWGNEKGDVVRISADWVNLTGFTVIRSGEDPTGYGYSGIELSGASSCYIANNEVLVNFHGIVLRNSAGNTIVNNEVYGNTDIGIFIEGSVMNTVANNVVYLNGWAGIVLTYSSGNTVANNTVSDNQDGIYVLGSTYNTISDNNFSNYERGIHLFWSEDNAIIGNAVSGHSWAGIILYYYSHYNSIVGNAVSDNRFGIFIDSSDRISVTNNTVDSSSQAGILILLSESATLAGNVMTQDSIFIYGNDSIAHWNTHVIDMTNSVNDRPVYYWKNVTGGTVPYDAGEVILVNCTDVTVENLDLSGVSVGIELVLSSGIGIQNNEISSIDWHGIYLYDSDMNVIANNTFSSGRAYGAFVFLSDNNTITQNALHATRVGLCVNYSNNNTIEDNIISENEYGIFFHTSNQSTITNNTVISNSGKGLTFFFSDVNEVYHNNFVDNTQQAMDNTGTNYYDDGYPSGGNFWSDSKGVDEFSGPNQDQPGSDGIGDTPYLMTLGRRDYYPLMSALVNVPARPPEILWAALSGENGENVTIAWDLSPDDGQGFDSVLGYEVYREVTYDPQGSSYELIGSLPNGASTFVDGFAGEGRPDNYFYRVCAVDTDSNTVCSSNQAGKFTRLLARGPNLVSVPLIQSNESTDIVLQTVEFDKAWYYDSSSQEWKWYMKSKEYRRGLWNVNRAMGVWVNVTENSNLTVAGVVPPQTSIHLTEGWNLVSFPSLNSTYTVADLKAEIGATRVEGYDLAPPNFLRVLGDTDILQAGYGYWVRVEADTVWTITIE